MDILNMSALELSKNIQSGVISVKEAVDACPVGAIEVEESAE